MDLVNQFRDAFKNIQIRERSYLGIIALLILVVLTQSIINNNLSLNRVFTIAIPPKLDSGVIIKTDTVNLETVYDFAGAVLQQLYFWLENGDKDFITNINKYANYLTPEYKAYLLKEYENLKKQGQLNQKTRSLVPLSKKFKLTKQDIIASDDSWLVMIDFQLQEYIGGQVLRNFPIRYFINVVDRNINPELNPWGWQLDVPQYKPKRLKENAQNV